MIKSEKGAAFVMTLITLVVLSIFAVTLILIGSTEQKQSIMEANRIKAYYVARSGADAVAASIINNVNNARSILNASNSAVVTGNVTDGSFSVQVSRYPADDSIQIVSTGTVGSSTNKAVLTLSKRTAQQTFNSVLVSNSTSPLNLDSVKIYNSDGTKPVITANSTITPNPDFYKPSTGMYNWVLQENANIHFEPLTFPIPSGVYPGGVINSSGQYTTIDTNSQLVFDTGTGIYAKELVIYVNDFSVRDDVIINGDGKVSLYVKHSALFQTPHSFSSSPDKFFIYLNDGATCDIAANGTFNAYIYGPYADIHLQSDQTQVFGSIIGNVITHTAKPTITYVPLPSNSKIDQTIVSYKRNQWN